MRNHRVILFCCIALVIFHTYFLIDLKIDLSGCLVIETGGMKGRRKELSKAQMHELLCRELNISKLYSEYGMTELLSQAYSKKNGIFKCPKWMKIFIRDINTFNFFK